MDLSTLRYRYVNDDGCGGFVAPLSVRIKLNMREEVKDKIVVRRWRESDFHRAVKLNMDAEVELGIPPETGSWELDMVGVKEVFLDSGGDFLVGFMGDEMILMGGFKIISPDTAEVKRMRILPEYHRLGLGSWLLNMLEQEMKKGGIVKVLVSTLDVQNAALGLYRSNGYTEVARKSGSGGESKFQVVSFEKKP